MATDPVCTMKVDEESTEFTTEYDGITYFFCSNACLGATQSSTSLQRSMTAAVFAYSPVSSPGRYCNDRAAGLSLGEIHGREGVDDELVPDIPTEIDRGSRPRLKEGHDGYKGCRAA